MIRIFYALEGLLEFDILVGTMNMMISKFDLHQRLKKFCTVRFCDKFQKSFASVKFSMKTKTKFLKIQKNERRKDFSYSLSFSIDEK